MAIADDFTIDYLNRRITHTSGADVYSVNALYSYLMDTFDEPSQMDDTVPMSAQTPTDYTIINGWFMGDVSYKFLKGGAIKTSGYKDNIHVIPFSSTAGAIPSDIGLPVTDDGGAFGTLLDYSSDGLKWFVRTGSATTAASGSVMAVTGGTGTGNSSAVSKTGEDLFANVYTLGSIEEDDSQQIYIIQNGLSLTEWWPESGSGTRHIDVLIKTKESDLEIDDGKITVFLRHYPSGGTADLYDHFDIDLSGGGRNAVPLATSPDLNNTSTHAVVSLYSDITIAWVNGTIPHGAITGASAFTNFETVTGSISLATAIVLLDTAGVMTLGNIEGVFQSGEVLHGSTSGADATTSSTVTVVNTMKKAFIKQTEYDYSVIIDCASRRLSEVYEYLKYVLRENSTFPTFGIKNTSGTLTQNPIDGEQYIRAYTDVTTPSLSYTPTKASPFGTFAGGKFFGARGVWIENMDPLDILALQLIDSTNGTQTPPNQQTITVSNLIASDRVAVFRTTSGTTINKSVYTATANNDLGNTTFVVNEAISADTPSSGTIRIIDTTDVTSSREVRYTYTSWDTSTFSGIALADAPYTAGLDRNYVSGSCTAYVPFIDAIAASDTAAATVIYAVDRSILVRVRRYSATAILPFETTGTFGSTGFSIATIRTPDTIVS